MLATFSISENYNSQTLTFLRMQAPGRCLFIDAKSEYRLFLTGSNDNKIFSLNLFIQSMGNLIFWQIGQYITT